MPGFVHTVPGFPVRYACVAAADSADVVALVAGAKIRVLSAFISMASTGTFKFQSGATTDITEAATTTAENLIVVLPFNPMGWFETTAGAKLNIVLSSAIATSVMLTYVHI
jgi:hypothetical protein